MLAGTTALGCGMTVCVALWSSGSTAAETPESKAVQFGGWTITITPGPVAARGNQIPPSPVRLASYQEQPAPPAPAPEPIPAATSGPVITPCDPQILAQSYRSIYESIPFSRVEYDANPSYRHDLAVEILFGQMRPTVIQKGHTSVNVDHHYDTPMYGPFHGWTGAGYYYPNIYSGVRVYRGF